MGTPSNRPKPVWGVNTSNTDFDSSTARDNMRVEYALHVRYMSSMANLEKYLVLLFVQCYFF